MSELTGSLWRLNQTNGRSFYSFQEYLTTSKKDLTVSPVFLYGTPFYTKHVKLFYMRYLLAIACLILCTSIQAQYRLFVKNDDSTKINIHMGTSTVDIMPHKTEEVPVHLLTERPGYILVSDRGKFAQGTSSADHALPAGDYILIFMWNAKNDCWRTVIRPKTDAD